MRHSSVRPARADDVDAICAISNEGIADRATLETEPRTPDERRHWLAARDARHPVVVVESDGVVVGWASLNVFNARDAYRHVADISVYVPRASRGKGAGTALLERGERCALSPARFPRGRRLPGAGPPGWRWVDVVLMERLLWPHSASEWAGLK